MAQTGIKEALQFGFILNKEYRIGMGVILCIFLYIVDQEFVVNHAWYSPVDRYTVDSAIFMFFVIIETVFACGYEVFGNWWSAILNVVGVVCGAIAVNQNANLVLAVSILGTFVYFIQVVAPAFEEG